MLENDKQQPTISTADNSKQIQLIKTGLAIYMHQEFAASEKDALDKLMLEVAAFQAKLKLDPTATAKSYIKLLANADIAPAVIASVKAAPSLKYDIRDVNDIMEGLDKLKFSEDEILDMMINLDKTTLLSIKVVWDPIKLLTTDISEVMTKEFLTVPDAINAVLSRGRDRYKQGIEHYHFSLFLSPEARIQLYLHARVGMVMGKQTYNHNNDENTSLRNIAQFHAQRNNKLFLAVDYALKDLKFPIAETYALLQANDNISGITELHNKVSLVQTYVKEIKALMTGPSRLNFESAEAAMFNETSPLSEQDFTKFVSPALKTQLTPAMPAISSTAAALQKLVAKQEMPAIVAPAIAKEISFPAQLVTLPVYQPVNSIAPVSNTSLLQYVALPAAVASAAIFALLLCARPIKSMYNSAHRKFGTKPKTEEALPTPVACRKQQEGMFHRH